MGTETYDHVSPKACNLCSSHDVTKYLGHHGTVSCSSGAALQEKAGLELRGNKAGRAVALRQRPHPIIPKQEKQSRSGDGNQEQPMTPIASLWWWSTSVVIGRQVNNRSAWHKAGHRL